MDWQDPFFMILMLVGIIFLVAGLLMYRFPPKSINYLYGYRTKSSMTDKDTWDFAQRYSSIEMMKLGAGFMATSCASSLLPIPDLGGTILALIILILAVILMFVRVEKAIRMRNEKE